MSPMEIMAPVILVLAAYGYVRLLARYIWRTLAATIILIALVSLSFPFRPETALTWIGVTMLWIIAIVLARMWPEVLAQGPVALPKPSKKLAKGEREIVMDGTNIMYWDAEKASLSTLRAVVDSLKARKFLPYVFLDASSRHHLKDKSLTEAKFAEALGLHQSRVVVCPAGTEADVFILKFAKTEGLPILSNDRFRDRAQQLKGIKLVKGTFARGKPILDGL